MSNCVAVFRILFIAAFAATFSGALAQQPAGGSRPNKALVKKSSRGSQSAKGQLSEKECAAFVNAIAKALNAGDAVALNNLIDWDALVATAASDLRLPAAERQGLIRGLKSDNGVAANFASAAKAGMKFKCLRTRQAKGRLLARFRQLAEGTGGGLNYYDFVVTRSAAGKVQAVDIYPYLTAEMISATIRRGLLPIIASANRGLIEKLITREQDIVRDLPKIADIASLNKQKKYGDALAQIKTLGPDTQKEKFVLVLRMTAAQNSDELEYTAVLEDFRRFYPNDPSLDMVLIDYYTVKKEFAKVSECIDRVDKTVGGDPYLDVMRANLSHLRADLPAAERFAKRAIEKEPTLLAAYDCLIGVALKTEKHEITLATLKTLDQRFAMTFNDLESVPEYGGFVKSPQFKEWQEYLAQKSSRAKSAKGTTPARSKKASAVDQ